MDRETKQSVQALMVRLADGDRSAFDPLFALLWPIVRRFADRALNGASDAEDAAQLALLKVFARAVEFDRERDAATWVLGVAAYECKTFRQKHKRRREAPAPAEERESNAQTPEQALIARDLEHAACDVLGALRPADVETLQALIQGLRPPVSGATFRKRVERALDRLRTAWSSRHGAVNPSPLLTIIAGAALLILSILMQWRGQTWGYGAKIGLVAGSVPFLVPVVLRSSGHCCIGGVCWSGCMLACVVGGLFAGVIIGLLSALEREQRGVFIASATAIAAIAGSLGCAMAGAMGIVGMLVAVIASTLPIAVIARPRAMA